MGSRSLPGTDTLKGLRKMTPSATVLTNTRFVDNGHVITTAGVFGGY